MRKIKRCLAFFIFAVLLYPIDALASDDWNNSDNTVFSFRILMPYTDERFLKDESIRLLIEPWGEMDRVKAFVCLTHIGVDYNEIRTTKKKVFKDAYFYQNGQFLRADLDIDNVMPGRYTLWVEFKDEENGEHALGNVNISIVGKASDTGWLLAGDNNYYYLRGNKAVRNMWLLIHDRWFAFDNAGIMYRAWSKIENNWYYFEDNGGLVYGWLDYSNNRYFLGEYGQMVTGWQKIAGELYYFAENGTMQTGEQTIDNERYVFDETGKMISGNPDVKITPVNTPAISLEPIVEY